MHVAIAVPGNSRMIAARWRSGRRSRTTATARPPGR